MAQTGYTPILTYGSTTPGNIPTNTNLTTSSDGVELAVNAADGKLFYKDSGGTVQVLATKAGASGDVVGPASATDNAVVRFDGTTGKLVQNSAATIADTTGDITAGKYNGLTVSTTTGTLTLTNGKTFAVQNTLTLSGTDSTTMTFPATSQTLAGLAVSSQIFTTAQTFRAASSVRAEAAATQDAIVLAGRAGGTSSYAVTFTPTTLSAGRTVTLPDADINFTTGLGVAQGGTGQTSYTNGQLLIGNTTGNTLTKSTLTAGSGISITNGTGSITIAATNTGDVVGPASSTDNAITRFDGTTGKLVQNSSATITDGGKLTANGGIATRTTSAASASSLTPDVSTTDLYAYTALAANLAIAVPTGTPADGDKLLFRFLDNGTTRTITFTGGVSGGFRPCGVTLTTSGSDFTFSTTINKTTYIGAIYNAGASRWDVVALTTEA